MSWFIHLSWGGQLLTMFIVWFILAWLYAEGTNPFKPTWLNNIGWFVGGACKVFLFLLLVLGLSGLSSSNRK